MFNDIQLEYVKSLGQLETGRNNSKTIGKNNFFNIKDFSGKGPRAFDKAEGSNDAYLNFETPDDAYAHLYDLFKRNYPRALEATNINDFAKYLKEGGYATDPNYVQKLVNVHNSRMRQTAQTSQKIDLSKYQDQYGDAINAARAQGFTDARILDNIKQDEEFKNRQQIDVQSRQQVSKTINELAPEASRQVAARLAKNGDPIEGVAYLQTLPGYRDEIAWAKEQGFSNEQILKNLVPDSLVGLNAYQKRKGTSFLTNTIDGLTDTINQYGIGARQLLNFDPQRERELIAEEEARRLNPDRVALQQTYGYALGNVLPELAVGAATSGSSLAGSAIGRIGLGAAISAGSAGLRPVAGDESRAQNMLVAGVTGAAAGGLAEGATKLIPIAEKVKQTFSSRPTPIHDDILSRAVSQKLSNDLGVKLNSQYVDNQWFSTVGKNLSDEYDALLDGNKWKITDDLKNMIMDPNVTQHLNPADLEALNNLIYTRQMRSVAVRAPELDASGNQVFDITRKVVRDEKGFPIKDPYTEVKTITEPMKETYHVPKFEYQMGDPKMVRSQIVGSDGKVVMVPQTVWKTANVPVTNELGQITPEIRRFKFGMTEYHPQTAYKEIPAQMQRVQARDSAGNIIMTPKLRNVVDENGSIVMKTREELIPKLMTRTQEKPIPKYKYVMEKKPVEVLRETPIELRDAYYVLRQLKSKIADVDAQADPLQREALAKLLDTYEEAFYKGAISSESNLSRSLVPGEKAGTVGFTSTEDLQNKLSDLNRRFGIYSMSKEVFKKANTSGVDFGNVNLWNSVSKNGRYGDRFVKGVSPNIEIVKALQQNAADVAAHDSKLDVLRGAGDAVMTSGYMSGHPAITALGGGLKFLSRAKQAFDQKPVTGLTGIIDHETLKKMVENSKKQIPTNVERRVENVPVEVDRRSPRTLKKTLQKLRAKNLIVIETGASQE